MNRTVGLADNLKDVPVAIDYPERNRMAEAGAFTAECQKVCLETRNLALSSSWCCMRIRKKNAIVRSNGCNCH